MRMSIAARGPRRANGLEIISAYMFSAKVTQRAVAGKQPIAVVAPARIASDGAGRQPPAAGKSTAAQAPDDFRQIGALLKEANRRDSGGARLAARTCVFHRDSPDRDHRYRNRLAGLGQFC